MGRIRVVHIIPTLDQSGAEKQLCLLASHLPKERYDVRVLAISRGGFFERKLAEAGVEVEVIGKRLKWDPASMKRLIGRLRELRPDIVHTWLFAGNSYGRFAAIWAKCPRIVASERCVDSWKRQYQFIIDRWLARRTDRLVVNSEAVGQFYRRVGIDEKKIVVIPNAIEPLDPAEAPDLKRLRTEINLDDNALVVGFVGRLWPQKRVQDLIWASDILRIGGWEFHLAIIGDGPRRTALERLTASLDLRKIVHFLGHRADARDWISLFDVLVLPSRFEGMPNVVLEAMRAGKPVVATRIAGMDEVVVEGVTGFLAPPKRPMELARAISKLLNDAEMRRQFGAAGRKRVCELFSVERLVHRHEELYADLMSAPSLTPIR